MPRSRSWSCLELPVARSGRGRGWARGCGRQRGCGHHGSECGCGHFSSGCSCRHHYCGRGCGHRSSRRDCGRFVTLLPGFVPCEPERTMMRQHLTFELKARLPVACRHHAVCWLRVHACDLPRYNTSALSRYFGFADMIDFWFEKIERPLPEEAKSEDAGAAGVGWRVVCKCAHLSKSNRNLDPGSAADP